ncbi:MAG: hypothetical protein Q8N26_10745 [Myxococcales bacterium]|nr:hypothetical protein [Myxococcales bacterium]
MFMRTQAVSDVVLSSPGGAQVFTSFCACSFQLHWLEHDVFALIHLENQVLRPRLAATGAA